MITAILISEKFAPVTPSDTVSLSPTVGVYVGGAGDLAVVGADGIAATFKAVPVGTIIPGNFQNVKATGTTATNIVALMR